ncbi:MAG: M48 family metallopeptidase [Betaproteobacteria bacterium]|nr:M48 family metallopeptidase [Betaproteobacteria bacterium]
MRWRYLLILMLFAVPRALAESLPDLGDVAQSDFSPLQERRLGEQIMREIRADRSFYDDAEAADYINTLGERLVARSPDARQNFDFFLIQDGQINAFALPGGFVGVNSGLLLNAQSESEVASVLAHEIAHVTQRHIARMLAQQKQSQITSLAALAVAILAARASSQAAQAAAAFGTASAIQSQLNFTREHEREADRVGVQILEQAGFDPHAMATFFDRLQRATRVYEGGAPSYLRTHPLTFERIADIQNRVEHLPYRQVPDSLEFQLIRAKLRAEMESPRDAVAYFEQSLAERKFLSEAASRYGLAVSLLRAQDHARARKELAAVRKLAAQPSPVLETLDCRLKTAAGEGAAAFACYREALKTYPNYRALTYDYANALLQNRRPDAALKLVEDRLQVYAEDYKLYLLQARSYAMLNKRLAQHRAQGEAYVRMGNIPGAVEQLQIALKSGDGDFYQLSSTEARLRELRQLHNELRKEQRKER